MIDLDRIRAGIAIAKRDGWRLAHKVTVSEKTNICCAIGACYLAEETPVLRDDYLGQSLGFSPEEARAFVGGFDGYAERWTYDRPAYEAGRTLAQEEGLLDR